MRLRAAKLDLPTRFLALSLCTVSIWLSSASLLVAQDNLNEIDIDQIRKELAQLKAGEIQGSGTQVAAERNAPELAEAKDGMRDQFTVVAPVAAPVVAHPQEAKELSSQNAKLRSAEDDLLAELQKVSDAPTALPSGAQARASGSIEATKATTLQGVPVNESGQLDLDAIRERAVRKADLNASQLGTESSALTRVSESPGIVEKTIEIPGNFDLGQDDLERSIAIEKQLAVMPVAEKSAVEMVDAFDSRGISPNDSGMARAMIPARIEADRSAASDRNQVASLQSKLSSSERARAKLATELQEARNRLMIAETEVERLSARMDGGSRRSSPPVRTVNTPVVLAQPPMAQQVSYLPMKRDQQDMPVATVIVDKANLRTGPNMNDSPLMSISKGARLAIETRKGNWYRVIAPTGVRAWISSDMIAFGRDGLSSPTRTLSVRGYDEGLEGN